MVTVSLFPSPVLAHAQIFLEEKEKKRGNYTNQLLIQQCCMTTIPELSGLKLKSFILIYVVSKSAATWLGWAGLLTPGSRLSSLQVGFRSAPSLFHLLWASGLWCGWSALHISSWCPREREVVIWGMPPCSNQRSVRRQAQCKCPGQGCEHVTPTSHVHWPEQDLWPGPKSCFPVGDRKLRFHIPESTLSVNLEAWISTGSGVSFYLEFCLAEVSSNLVQEAMPSC